jgi:hypothetical protein
MAGRFRPRRRGLVALSSVAGLLVVGWLAPWPTTGRGSLGSGCSCSGVAGVAVIAAVVVTWQQLETDRRQLRQELKVAGAAQAGDRLARALDQLGSEQLDVRLGGI